MKITDDGEMLDRFCGYMIQHKKEMRIKVDRVTNTRVDLLSDKLFADEIGYVRINKKDDRKKELEITIWKQNIDKVNFDEFKNVLKTFEIKNKVNITIDMM